MDGNGSNFEEGVANFLDIVIEWNLVSVRGVAQLGSAPLWGSGGRGFKSRRSDSEQPALFRFLAAPSPERFFCVKARIQQALTPAGSTP